MRGKSFAITTIAVLAFLAPASAAGAAVAARTSGSDTTPVRSTSVAAGYWFLHSTHISATACLSTARNLVPGIYRQYICAQGGGLWELYVRTY